MAFFGFGIEIDMTQKKIPKPVRGLRHILVAILYSFGGFLRLWQETAFRLELVFGFLVVLTHVFLGNHSLFIAIAILLVLITLSVEALNTAIEVITDDISPNYSEMAECAKDLGSFAVFCLLLCNGLWLTYAVIIAVIGNN